MIFNAMKKYSILIAILFSEISSVFALERKSTTAPDQVLSETIGVSHYFQMFLGLFLIIILIFGLAWLVKRINNFQGSMNCVLKLMSMVSVGQREKIVLIQVGKQQLLIGVAPGKVNTLLVLDELIENKPISTIKTSFAEKLSSVMKGKKIES
jgi:flagellar protein FliO/FliZ